MAVYHIFGRDVVVRQHRCQAILHIVIHVTFPSSVCLFVCLSPGVPQRQPHCLQAWQPCPLWELSP